MTNEIHDFQQLVINNVEGIGRDQPFLDLSNQWVQQAIKHQYALNFSWLGRPIIQAPQDTYAMQELIWKVKPDLIIETGIAHGGSLIMSASMLAMLDYCNAVAKGETLNPLTSRRRVLGIDIDIRPHNRAAIESHPLGHLLEMIEGSSISDEVIKAVTQRAASFEKVMVFLDSNHTHAHVYSELEAYAPLVSCGSYCVVWDTGVENLPDGFVTDRPWGKGNNPKTAVLQYLKAIEKEQRYSADGKPLKYQLDKLIEHKIAITSAPDGFMLRT